MRCCGCLQRRSRRSWWCRRLSATWSVLSLSETWVPIQRVVHKHSMHIQDNLTLTSTRIPQKITLKHALGRCHWIFHVHTPRLLLADVCADRTVDFLPVRTRILYRRLLRVLRHDYCWFSNTKAFRWVRFSNTKALRWTRFSNTKAFRWVCLSNTKAFWWVWF